MALKKINTETTGKSRWYTREEVKNASRKLRRMIDKKEAVQ